MIVTDASAVVELLTGGAFEEVLMRELGAAGEGLLAPHVLDLEVVSAIRRLAGMRKISADRLDRIFSEFSVFPVRRYPHAPLLRRIWELRHNFTAYDAAYIALAEATGATLYTCDSKLATGHRARVRVFSLN